MIWIVHLKSIDGLELTQTMDFNRPPDYLKRAAVNRYKTFYDPTDYPTQPEIIERDYKFESQAGRDVFYREVWPKK